MTILGFSGNVSRSGTLLYNVKCDECEKVYEYHGKLKRLNRRYHFCSRTCSNASQRHGVLLKQVIETNRERYGCDFPTQAQHVLEKQKQTNLERYGEPSTLSKLAREMFRKKYGVDNPSQLPDHHEKVKHTSLDKYGVEHPFAAEEVKRKIRRTVQERYGTAAYVASDDFKQKAIATNVKNLGCSWPLQSSVVKEKFDWKRCAQRRHETMKSRGQYVSSVAEQTFGEYLRNVFGCTDVQQHIIIGGFEIDFYVKSIDTYVQFDGVYWHGLDRPTSDIERSKSPRDKVILSTLKRDERQNETFLGAGLRLVRVTDKEFKAAVNCLSQLSLIEQKIRGSENGN